jgi:hypothetical protein
MVVAVVCEFANPSEFERCRDSSTCVKSVEKLGRRALRVNWQPITIFPEAAARFKK